MCRRLLRVSKRWTFVLSLLIAALSCLIVRPLRADPPTQEETDLFNTVRTRMNGHAGQMPHGVGAANQSLEDACYTKSFTCPAGSAVNEVNLKVCTRLVHWTANPTAGDEAAAYTWDTSPEVTSEDGKKTIQYDNEIMIDASVFAPAEGEGAIGQTLNEGLLYHELLHGQLGIEWFESEGKTAACQCQTPDPGQHADGGHTQISGWQDGFVIGVAGVLGANVQIMRPVVPASATGGISMVLGQKPNWHGIAIVPDGGNVRNVVLFDPRGDGTIVLQAEIIDGTKPGRVIVIVDPPGFWIHAFVEIEPNGATPVPKVSWGRVKMLYR